MIELTEDSLEELITQNDKVIVQYGAAWCGNCRITKPKFRRMAGEHEYVQFVYVDAEKLPRSRKLAEIKNLPTFASFKDGRLVGQLEGNKMENVKSLVDEITGN